MIIKVEIMPKSDEYNSYPHDQTFEIRKDEVMLNVDNSREITFRLSDLKKIIQIVESLQDQSNETK